MGELRGRAAVLSEPALVFAGRALFPLPKQLFRLYTHLLRYLLKSEAYLPRASGTPARFHAEKRAYETEFGELKASTVAVVCGKTRIPRVGDAFFVALAAKESPEEWAHALVFRSNEKTQPLYDHLKKFHLANPKRFLPNRFSPHPVTKEAAMDEYRRCFPVTVFDMEMNYERPIQFAGRRLSLSPDGTVETETLSLYVRQKPKLSRYVAELTHLTDLALGDSTFQFLWNELFQRLGIRRKVSSGIVSFSASFIPSDNLGFKQRKQKLPIGGILQICCFQQIRKCFGCMF